MDLQTVAAVWQDSFAFSDGGYSTAQSRLVDISVHLVAVDLQISSLTRQLALTAPGQF